MLTNHYARFSIFAKFSTDFQDDLKYFYAKHSTETTELKFKSFRKIGTGIYRKFIPASTASVLNQFFMFFQRKLQGVKLTKC